MSACYQNAWLLINTVSTPIITFRERPCMPAKAKHIAVQDNCMSVKVVCENGTVIEWYPDGTVQETLPNGNKTIFPAKPTYTSFLNGSYILAEFFLGYLSFQPYLRGNYLEFNANGVTIYRRNGQTFLWSQEFAAKEVDGVISFSIGNFDDEDFWRSERSDSFS